MEWDPRGYRDLNQMYQPVYRNTHSHEPNFISLKTLRLQNNVINIYTSMVRK